MDISAARLRAVRAALFTALCVTLSAASHVLLSRAPLPLPIIVLLCGVVFGIAYALAGRERSYGAIAALLIPLELAADTVFTAGQHACYGQAGGPVAGPLRTMGVDLLCHGGDVGSPLAQLTADGGSAAVTASASAHSVAPWLLLTAHVAVGLIAAAWLRRGEAALSQVVRALTSFAFRPLLVAFAAVVTDRLPRSATRPACRPLTARSLPLLLHSVVRRGPPPVWALA
ncbi:hypothetical protein [Streptomyces zagrosensis]|uniref:Integral membrane protein n=1 Tax=Streptomyces zagrosensis TaxID=1042984 RepID=A0A7W9Q6L6_9ACTN|nr:hypothetical protein [Streptomyces zagrosensis]MBB5933502.1 hypothetical protein [Streptomyces zagrosensis]